MKILQTSDWHIGSFPGPERNGVNLRGQDTYNCINYLIEVAQKEQPDLTVISGDLFHVAKCWADRGINETYNAINIIKQLSMISHVCILRGTPNHDGAEQFNMIKEVFKDDTFITIFDIPRVEVISTRSGNINVAALPGFDRGIFRAKFPGLSKEEENHVFTDELGKIVLALRAECTTDHPAILISHYTVPGCNTESGQTQFLAQFEPVILPDVLDAAAYDLVAFGHIHRPQQVTSCKNTFYSGAINALNFNDEGQDRGFWLHELSEGNLTSSFIKTFSREFATFRFTDTDIAGINTGEIDNVAHSWWGYNDGAKDKIVRVLYNCTDENSKAFNKALLEKRLYDDGAFWVSEITPEKITITANKNELSEKSDPEANLRNYLMEKAVPEEKIADIIEAARPIISEATANSIVSRLTGIFEPVEIEVKNYRNYVEEKFSFKDITFCTINGNNGAGKSSLFMDAILDCLYEEPREGDLTGWIRADDDARSGAISFTFCIGDKTFRVTRTRAKSGKATLNISELINGEWENRSKEKIKDTQDEIVNILGMDSLTFKSCALIMQDQYGLFLQADKEARMTILGNILGLGIYSDMEELARYKVTDINRSINQCNNEIKKLAEIITAAGDIEADIAEKTAESTKLSDEITQLNTERDNINLRLSSKLEAAARALKLQEGIDTLTSKKASTEAQIKAQEDIISNSNLILSQESEILYGVSEYNLLLEKEKTLISGKTLYKAKSDELAATNTDIATVTANIQKLQDSKNTFISRKAELQKRLERETELKGYADQQKQEREKLAALESKSEAYINLSNLISVNQKQHADLKASYNSEVSRKVTLLNGLKEKAALLENCNCIDPTNANCKFLSDAQDAKKKIESYTKECSEWKAAELKKLNDIEQTVEDLIRQRDEVGYDAEAIKVIRDSIAKLDPMIKEYEGLSTIREQVGLVDERLTSADTSIVSEQQRLSQLKIKADKLTADIEDHKTVAGEYDNLVLQISDAKRWLEKEKLLPVAKEKKTTAEARIVELKAVLSDIAFEIVSKQQELDVENQTANGSEELKKQLALLDSDITDSREIMNALQMKIGALKQKAEDIKKTLEQVAKLQKDVNDLSEKVTLFEVLKQAFSQDGIPHNIIRSIVPQLTATANNILGQMTGGKMGMEFRTEKVLKSNSKKEVVTLDIFIEEYGKASLPYLSKSGGEKVKSALSAILSLAEIKSTSAGIQLGMLFIDEPPFLDGDGIQAYCDALETIQSRYRNLKIMAITHDPTMKARFPQSLDVIKTDEGSKVLFY